MQLRDIYKVHTPDTGKKSREAAVEALLKGLVAGGEEVRICGAYKGFQLVVRGGETNKFYLRGSHVYVSFVWFPGAFLPVSDGVCKAWK